MGEHKEVPPPLSTASKVPGNDVVESENLLRGSWIFCGGMKRSGSTLQYLLASELIERTGFGSRTPWIDQHEHSQVLGAEHTSGFRTFKSHILTKEIAHHCEAGNAFALYIYRDIRDVVSSIQQKSNVRYLGQSLTNLIVELMDADTQWRSLPKVYVSRYRDVIEREFFEVSNIAAFLNIQAHDSILKEIAENIHMKRVKRLLTTCRRENGLKTHLQLNITHIHCYIRTICRVGR